MSAGLSSLSQGRQPLLPFLKAPGDVPLSNYDATVAPTVTDDASKGYGRGSQWLNTFDNSAWVLADSTTGAALWIQYVAAGVPVLAHNTSHEDGGSDEISVEGLSGELADSQKHLYREAAGADVGPRRRTSITGLFGIGISIADDVGSDEVDIEIDGAALLALDGSRVMTGNLDFGGFKGVGLATPSAATDAATKAYVDAAAAGARDPKDAAYLATAAALAAYTRVGNVLTANANGALTVDGVAVAVGDRVLVNNTGTATGADRGLFSVTDTGSAGTPWILTRTTDADTSAEVTDGLFIYVTQGVTNLRSGWLLTTADPITLNTTSLNFVQVSGLGDVTAGAGLTKTGNQLDVVANADGSIVANANDLQVGILATDAQHGVRGGGTQHAVATALANGFMVAADFSKLAAIVAEAAPGMIMWGADNVAATTTTRYLFPYNDDSQAQITTVQMRVTRAGTLRKLRIRHETAAGNGGAIVYTLRKNGVATALTVSILSTANDGSDLVHSVTVAAGDLVDIEVTKAAGVGTSPSDITATAEFAA